MAQKHPDVTITFSQKELQTYDAQKLESLALQRIKSAAAHGDSRISLSVPQNGTKEQLDKAQDVLTSVAGKTGVTIKEAKQANSDLPSNKGPGNNSSNDLFAQNIVDGPNLGELPILADPDEKLPTPSKTAKTKSHNETRFDKSGKLVMLDGHEVRRAEFVHAPRPQIVTVEEEMKPVGGLFGKLGLRHAPARLHGEVHYKAAEAVKNVDIGKVQDPNNQPPNHNLTSGHIQKSKGGKLSDL